MVKVLAKVPFSRLWLLEGLSLNKYLFIFIPPGVPSCSTAAQQKPDGSPQKQFKTKKQGFIILYY